MEPDESGDIMAGAGAPSPIGPATGWVLVEGELVSAMMKMLVPSLVTSRTRNSSDQSWRGVVCVG
jgi:hypothetical protein